MVTNLFKYAFAEAATHDPVTAFFSSVCDNVALENLGNK